MRKGTHRVVAAIFALSLIAAACGSDGPGTNADQIANANADQIAQAKARLEDAQQQCADLTGNYYCITNTSDTTADQIAQAKARLEDAQQQCADLTGSYYCLTTTTVTPPSTSNKPVQPVAPQVPNGCDRAVTASLIISDYFYFNGDHSTSEIDSALAAISTFLERNGFGMEANAVDNASTLEDAIYTYRQLVPMLC